MSKITIRYAHSMIMHCVIRHIPVALILLAGTITDTGFAATSAQQVIDTIPPDSPLVMDVRVDRNDAGQKWFFDELTRTIIARATERKRAREVKEIDLFNVRRLVFAFLSPAPTHPRRMLMAADLLPSDGTFGVMLKDMPIQLKIRDSKAASRAQKQLLTYLLMLICEIPPGQEPENGIYFNPEGEKGEDFSAFHMGDTRVFLASRKDIIAGALARTKGIRSEADYREMRKLLPRGGDVYGVARRGSLKLVHTDDTERKGWLSLLLALLKPVERLGFALDIENRDKSTITLAFKTATPAEAAALQASLESKISVLFTEHLDKQVKMKHTFSRTKETLICALHIDNMTPAWEAIMGAHHTGKTTPTPAARAKKNTPRAQPQEEK